MDQTHDRDGIGRSKAAQPPLHGAGTVRLHRVPPHAIAALGVFALFTVLYFSHRIPLWNPAAPVLATLLLAAELFGTFTLMLHVVSTWCLVERRPIPVPQGFEADIFVTTWNESPEILRHTLLAARQVTHVRQVWLLDDGGRTEMQALARELGVSYLSRTDRSHAKAGNLNNALKHTDAQFVALFDCDHAPSPEFLERTLGYFADPSVAFVQTPQDFYNVDSFQHRHSRRRDEAWHEQALFYRVIQAGKDFWNATFFCGSCAVFRRSALEGIGGFATGTITEDMHTSIRLHKAGWSAAYHAEALAFGLSPANLDQYETQRLRWGRGAMQVWSKEGIVFARGLTLAQRIAYFTSAITYFEGWQKGVIYIMPIVVLTTGWMPIVSVDWPFVWLFLSWILSGMVVNEAFSRGYAKTLWMEEYNFLRFYTFIKATLALIVPLNWGFAVTPKDLTGRTGITLKLWPQMLVAAGAIFAIPVSAYLFKTMHHLPAGAFVANLVWVVLSGTVAIKALRFAARSSVQHRRDHRFVLPLAGRITIDCGGKRTIPIIAQDISVRGFGFTYGRDCPVAPHIRGELTLPSGPLRFAADVVRDRRDPRTGERHIGCEFRWTKAAEADPLVACLFGNTLQWDVNGWAEARRLTLLQRLRAALGGPVERPGPWRMARLEAPTGENIACVARTEAGTVRVLATGPLPATSALTLRLEHPPRVRFGLQVAGYRAYRAGTGHFHMAVLATDSVATPVSFHREPSWVARKDAA